MLSWRCGATIKSMDLCRRGGGGSHGVRRAVASLLDPGKPRHDFSSRSGRCVSSVQSMDFGVDGCSERGGI